MLLYSILNSKMQSGVPNALDEAIISMSSNINTTAYAKVDEIPYDFMRKRVSIVAEDAQHRQYLITKGAPEEIVKICPEYEGPSGVLALDDAALKKFTAWHDDQSSRGMRILGVCYREVSQLNRTQFGVADEKDMIFLGLLTFIDPPKEDARDSLERLRKSNIELKILTGDNELVSKYVCEQLGFEVTRMVLGKEIESVNDDGLRQLVEGANLFARVTPIDKNRIMNALRKNDHDVGYMGDGINDAPSLKAADVGISVDNAVDVAKESADMILLQKNLSVLNDGVLEGRKTFGNTMKYLMMGISSNFGNMFSMAGAVLILPFLPMQPTQILLNNLMYDVSESTIPSDNVDEEFLVKPKKFDMSFIRVFMLVFGLISSVFDYLTFFLMRDVFHAAAPLFQTAWFLESFLTQTSVIFVIRTRISPFWKSRPSRLLTARYSWDDYRRCNNSIFSTWPAVWVRFSPSGTPCHLGSLRRCLSDDRRTCKEVVLQEVLQQNRKNANRCEFEQCTDQCGIEQHASNQCRIDPQVELRSDQVSFEFPCIATDIGDSDSDILMCKESVRQATRGRYHCW